MNNSTTCATCDGTTMVIPQENDVLLVGLEEAKSHPGTSFYWRKIQEFTNKKDQNCTESKATNASCTSSTFVPSSNDPDPVFSARMNQAKMILQHVTSQKPPGRFLKRSEDTRSRITNNGGIWEVLDNEMLILASIMADLKHYQDNNDNVPTQTENHLINNDSKEDESPAVHTQDIHADGTGSNNENLKNGSCDNTITKVGDVGFTFYKLSKTHGRIKGTVLQIKDNGGE